MELSEAFVRVVGRHIVLIALLVAVGLLGAGLLHGTDPTQYRATARLALGTGDPSTQAQSAVMADTTRALATGRTLVADALRKVGARRDPVDTAQHHVSAQSLGSSGVVSVAVTDNDPGVAVALANEIASGVVRAHSAVLDGTYNDTLSRLNATISQSQRSIASIDAHIKAVGPLFDVTVPNGGVSLSERPWAEPNQLLRQRADLVATLSALTSERANAEGDRALHAQGGVVDAATGPADRVTGRLVPDLALGGLLGLVLGLALAAMLETLRPTLVGRDALARHLGAPVLAEVRGAATSEVDVAEAAMHIELAAVGADVSRVGLLALGRQLDVRPLADLLDHSIDGLALHVIGPHGPVLAPTGSPGQRLTTSTMPGVNGSGAEWQPAVDGATGVVLVTPRVVRLADLTRIVEFFTISGWPLLGLIVVHGRRGPIHLLGRHDAPPGPGASAALDTTSH